MAIHTLGNGSHYPSYVACAEALFEDAAAAYFTGHSCNNAP